MAICLWEQLFCCVSALAWGTPCFTPFEIRVCFLPLKAQGMVLACFSAFYRCLGTGVDWAKKTHGSLDTFWGEGTFDDKRGYRFGAGQGLVVEQGRCIAGPAYTIYIKASLDSVGNSILMSSDGWVHFLHKGLITTLLPFLPNSYFCQIQVGGQWPVREI